MPLIWNDQEVKQTVAHLAWDTATPDIADRAVEAVREAAPLGETGELRESIRAQTVAAVGGLKSIRIIADSDHSLVIERGRDEVVPQAAQTLHWINKLGNDVFATSSKAVPPNPFIERGLRSIGLRVVSNT